ncbi:3028_t:CDS:2 [Ambispora gerdemannii]|uniref:4-nitrophenylphosphatase n=1 Tax=Ambispora gerdemannii TaxID=144530 RepID=A0A9N9GK45_9GLOM|nr:3028_t:CDS:2 [Ambispora gerdemannii]
MTSPIPIKLETDVARREFIDKFDALLLDCDGVIWDGEKVLPGVRETLKYLRSKGKQLLFVSNNSSKSRDAYLVKFQKLGIEAHKDEIFGSAYTSAYYLKNVINFSTDKKVYVIGGLGITDELAVEGIRYSGSTADNESLKSMDFSELVPDPEVGAVLCGFDDHINYRKLAKAFTYLHSNSNCLFLLTNDDTTYPLNGSLLPGSGSLAAPLITALNRKPDCVIGKPNKPMLDCIMKKFHLNVKRTCMIGDRLDTDIQFGINGGIFSLLVLTGVSKEKEILANDAPIVPNYYVESLGDFATIIE